MKKLTLDMEALQVESFVTIATRGALGTVLAHDDATPANTCECFSLQECPTYEATCGGCVYSANSAGSYCTYDDCGGPNTIGVHCGPQGTMNPLWSECVINTQAGATCVGGSCGQACSYVNC